MNDSSPSVGESQVVSASLCAPDDSLSPDGGSSLSKRCSKCGTTKPITEFNRKAASKSGYASACRACCSAHAKNYRINNHSKLREAEKARYKRLMETNPEQIRASARKVQKKLRIVKRDYRHLHPEKYRKYRRAYEAARLKTDIESHLKHNLRQRLRSAIKGNCRTGSAVRDLGCTIPEFKTRLESMFKPGMTWDNWASDGWHIDHVMPLDHFDLSDPEQLRKAVHYTNLQPLWWDENLRKSNSILQDNLVRT